MRRAAKATQPSKQAKLQAPPSLPTRPAARLQKVLAVPWRQPGGHHHLLRQRHHALQPSIRQLKLPAEGSALPALAALAAATGSVLAAGSGSAPSLHRLLDCIGRVCRVGTHLDEAGGGEGERALAAALQPFDKLEGQPAASAGWRWQRRAQQGPQASPRSAASTDNEL